MYAWSVFLWPVPKRCECVCVWVCVCVLLSHLWEREGESGPVQIWDCYQHQDFVTVAVLSKWEGLLRNKALKYLQQLSHTIQSDKWPSLLHVHTIRVRVAAHPYPSRAAFGQVESCGGVATSRAPAPLFLFRTKWRFRVSLSSPGSSLRRTGAVYSS